ncbi:MAG: cupin domain-containing protein [Ignavibacteriales bacterium]|jgi:cupin 2 domain-containing protein|nr:cupin domain-containing protein [Ignavibacteriaceae bacterium]NLH59813.1 cupin domain-containing protein [Ignavibacteriales bacterium]HOJ18354.1 cupin domain-containing protein [Ignavibacteriaceae bacterium]HPO56764.1 cupin domain-containing protein [Ignavibacteriaceae bacterium]
MKNLFENIPKDLPEELIDEIISGDNFRFKRIVSSGHSSPEGFWYDQSENELVILISGSAGIEFIDNNVIDLKPGNYLIIPAHLKHRITYTSLSRETVWLALFYK